LVDGALGKQTAGYGGFEVYAGLYAKAAALAIAFARFQRCPDGNKRVALILMFTFLAINDHLLTADEEEAADVMLAVAEAPSDEAAMTLLMDWLPSRVTAVEDQG
jgi:death on curing protein